MWSPCVVTGDRGAMLRHVMRGDSVSGQTNGQKREIETAGHVLFLLPGQKAHLTLTNSELDIDWCQNERPCMILKAIMHSVSKHTRLSEPTTKIWMTIDPYYQRSYSPMILQKLWTFRRRYIVGTLTNKANNLVFSIILLSLYYRLSTDSKTRDLIRKWPWYLNGHLWSLAFEAWLLLNL